MDRSNQQSDLILWSQHYLFIFCLIHKFILLLYPSQGKQFIFHAVVANFTLCVALHPLNQNCSKLSDLTITEMKHQMKKYSIKQQARDLLLEARPKSDLAADKGTV